MIWIETKDDLAFIGVGQSAHAGYQSVEIYCLAAITSGSKMPLSSRIPFIPGA